jgi:hypothetical protein
MGSKKFKIRTFTTEHSDISIPFTQPAAVDNNSNGNPVQNRTSPDSSNERKTKMNPHHPSNSMYTFKSTPTTGSSSATPVLKSLVARQTSSTKQRTPLNPGALIPESQDSKDTELTSHTTKRLKRQNKPRDDGDVDYRHFIGESSPLQNSVQGPRAEPPSNRPSRSAARKSAEQAATVQKDFYDGSQESLVSPITPNGPRPLRQVPIRSRKARSSRADSFSREVAKILQGPRMLSSYRVVESTAEMFDTLRIGIGEAGEDGNVTGYEGDGEEEDSDSSVEDGNGKTGS